MKKLAAQIAAIENVIKSGKCKNIYAAKAKIVKLKAAYLKQQEISKYNDFLSR